MPRVVNCKTLPVKSLLEAGNAVALHWAINPLKKGGIVSIIGVYGQGGIYHRSEA